MTQGSRITMRYTCGNISDVAMSTAAALFGPAPAGVTSLESDGCPDCAPLSAVYPWYWCAPPAPSTPRLTPKQLATWQRRAQAVLDRSPTHVVSLVVKQLCDQAARYQAIEEALRFYASRSSYNSVGGRVRPVDRDLGRRAREALVDAAPKPSAESAVNADVQGARP